MWALLAELSGGEAADARPGCHPVFFVLRLGSGGPRQAGWRRTPAASSVPRTLRASALGADAYVRDGCGEHRKRGAALEPPARRSTAAPTAGARQF